VITLVGIVCEALHVLCYTGAYSFHYAEGYLEVIDALSITVALYGLVVFYGLTRDELAGRAPLAKFLSIKLIVMFTFYQGFVVRARARAEECVLMVCCSLAS
jgi:hypothetical protein